MMSDQEIGQFAEEAHPSASVGKAVQAAMASQSSAAPGPCIPCAINAALTAAGSSTPPPPDEDSECSKILKKIKEYINELEQRYNELLEDKHHLQWYHWNIKHPKYGSVAGHKKQFEDKKGALKNKMEEWNDNNCDDPDGASTWRQEANKWRTTEAPDPIPQPRPEIGSTSPSVVLKVVGVIAEVGLSLLLLTEILAALADPEPTTKLALMGLSAATISKLTELTGKQSGDNGGAI